MLAKNTFRNMVRFRCIWIQYNMATQYIHQDIRVTMENFVQTDLSFTINPPHLVLTGTLWGNWYALIISRFSLTHQWIHHNKDKSFYLYRNFMTYTPHLALTGVLWGAYHELCLVITGTLWGIYYEPFVREGKDRFQGNRECVEGQGNVVICRRQ